MFGSPDISLQPSLRSPRTAYHLIEAIGEDDFDTELLLFLNQTFGAEHCALFSLDGDRPSELAAVSLDGTDTAHRHTSLYLQTELWRRDPTMDAARFYEDDRPHFIRLDISALEDRELRDVVYPRVGERLLLCGHSVVGRIGLSMVSAKTGSPLPTPAGPDSQDLGALLLSILGKHASATLQRRRMLMALTSLDQIEACVAADAVAFPKREMQVCARIVYGISTLGIALDLGVGEETVMTYRKRIYQRLGIGSQRELLVWYISRWSRAFQQPIEKIRFANAAH